MYNQAVNNFLAFIESTYGPDFTRIYTSSIDAYLNEGKRNNWIDQIYVMWPNVGTALDQMLAGTSGGASIVGGTIPTEKVPTPTPAPTPPPASVPATPVDKSTYPTGPTEPIPYTPPNPKLFPEAPVVTPTYSTNIAANLPASVQDYLTRIRNTVSVQESTRLSGLLTRWASGYDFTNEIGAALNALDQDMRNALAEVRAQSLGQTPPPPYTPEPPGMPMPNPTENLPGAGTGTLPWGTPGAAFNRANPPQWWATGSNLMREDVTPEDWLTYRAVNEALPYLDPQSRQEAMQWLYRGSPIQYSRYANVTPQGGYVPYRQPPATEPLPTAPDQRPPMYQPGEPYYLSPGAPLTTEQLQYYLTPERIGNVVQQLGYEQVVGNLAPEIQTWLKGESELTPSPAAPGTEATKFTKEQGVQASTTYKAAMKWLEEALNTAKGGVGGTRAQQLLAAQHLDTLFREADKDLQTGGYKNLDTYRTLVENLVNPVVDRAPLSGLFGVVRAYIPRKDEYRRSGYAWRNPTAL